MKIISVINYKGGVGKTTLTANIAAVLASLGKKILLVDMDAQCSLTFSLMKRSNWQKLNKDGRTLKWWFDGLIKDGQAIRDLDQIIVRGNYSIPANQHFRIRENVRTLGEIAIAPSHLDLLDVDLDLAPLLYGREDREISRRFVHVLGALREALREIITEYDYDLALIDCPPNFNIVTQAAIVACDGIVIPVKPNYLSTLGVDHLIRKRNDLVKKFNFCIKDADLPKEQKMINPRIVAIVFSIWKVTSTGTGEMAAYPAEFRERIEVELLPQLAHNEKTVTLDGFRHLDSFFAEGEGLPAFLEPSSRDNDLKKRVRSDIEKTARKLAELAGIKL